MIKEYERVIELLDNIEKPHMIHAVERQLDELGDNPLAFTLLQNAIRDGRMAYPTRMAAAVTFNRIVSEKYYDLPEDNMFELYTQTLWDPKTPIRLKRAFESSLTTMLEVVSQETATRMVEEMSSIMLSLSALVAGRIRSIRVKGKQLELNSQDKVAQMLKACLLTLECLLNSQNHFDNVVEPTIRRILEYSLSVIPFSLTEECISSLKCLAETWNMVLQKLHGHSQAEYWKLGEWLSQKVTVSDWVFKVYFLGCDSDETFISTRKDMHPTLSLLKDKAAALHFSLLLQLNQSTTQPAHQLVGKHLEATRSIVRTLTLYSSHLAFLDHFEDLAVKLVSIIVLLLTHYRQYFEGKHAQLYHLVCVPLLEADEKENVLFKNDPRDYISLNEDCCGQQQYGVMKSETARLLEMICDQNQEASEYVVQNCVLAAKLRLQEHSNITSQAGSFPSLQTAFMILSILSFRIAKHPVELDMLRQLLNPREVREKVSHFQMARIFNFLAYNYTDVFRQAANGQLWVYLALGCKQNPSLQLVALDFISSVVEEYFSEGFVLDFANKLDNQGTLEFRLQILIKMVRSHTQKFSEDALAAIIGTFRELCVKLTDLYQRREKSHTMDIVNCLHLLRNILDKKAYLRDKLRLQAQIWRFTELLDMMTRIHLDDELVKILISFTHVQYTISQSILSITPKILEIFEVHSFNSLNYVLYLNQIAVLSRNVEVASSLVPHVLQAMRCMVLTIKENAHNSRQKYALGGSLLMLQNIVAQYGQHLRQIPTISEMALALIPEDDSPEDKNQPILIGRALNLLFLCHMNIPNHNSDLALRALMRFHSSPVFRGYDQKVICTCLSKQMFREKNINYLADMMLLMIRICGQVKEEAVPVKSKVNPKSIKANTTKFTIRKIENYESVLKVMTTPFSEALIPEQQVREITQQMKAGNRTIYEGLIRNLPPEAVVMLRGLLQQANVAGEKRKIVSVGGIRQQFKPALIPSRVQKRYLQDEDENEEEQQSKMRLKRKKKQGLRSLGPT